MKSVQLCERYSKNVTCSFLFSQTVPQYNEEIRVPMSKPSPSLWGTKATHFEFPPRSPRVYLWWHSAVLLVSGFRPPTKASQWRSRTLRSRAAFAATRYRQSQLRFEQQDKYPVGHLLFVSNSVLNTLFIRDQESGKAAERNRQKIVKKW